MNSLHTKMQHAKFGWTWSSDSGGKNENTFLEMKTDRRMNVQTDEQRVTEKYLDFFFSSAELKWTL